MALALKGIEVISISNLTIHTFHKSTIPRMQTDNLANNSHKQFYVLFNTNQIKLYPYPDLLKENPLLRLFSTQNQQLTF